MTVRPTGSLLVMGYSALARRLSILDFRTNAAARSAVYKKTGRASTPISHVAASFVADDPLHEPRGQVSGEFRALGLLASRAGGKWRVWSRHSTPASAGETRLNRR